MEEFKNYVVSEFNVDGTTSILFKFSHSLSVKIDKKTKKPLNNHTINVIVQFYDRNLTLLRRETLKFVNNVLNKKDAERLVKIAPKELENRFNFARRAIVSIIQDEYIEKINDINDKLNALRLYENVEVNSNNVIPSEFKGELVQINNENNSDKQKFDM